MKKLNILLLPFLSVALASCVTTKIKSSSVDEKIYSILYQPQEYGLGQVYAIGEKYDYQIKPCQERHRAVVAINANDASNNSQSYCQKSLEFILKHKDEMKVATLDFALSNSSSSIQVHSGAYNAIFLRNKIKANLIQEKNSTIQELTIGEINQLHLY